MEMETDNKINAGSDDANKDKLEGASGEERGLSAYAVESHQSEVLDLRVLFVEIGRKWWLIILFLAIGTFIGVRDMHGFGGAYIARMVVAPIGDNTASAPKGSSGLVNVLAGLQIQGTKKITKFDQLVHSTKTLAFARILDEKYQLMDRHYGAGFDKETNTWRKPQGFEFEIREKINAYLKLPVWMPPSLEDLANSVGGSFKVDDIEDTPFVEITYSSGDPKVALEMLLMIYNEAESLVRKREAREQNQQRRFIEQRYSETTIREFKLALIDMMAEQARQEMMSHEDLPSVARIVEPAFVSKYKSTPNVLRMVGVPIFGAVGLAIGFILLSVLIRKE